MTDDFFQGISNTGSPFEYADNVRRYQTQLPLGISWPTMTGSLTPRDLYSDDNSIYMYYPSGLNKTAIEIQQRDRYGGVTFTLLSGSVNLFIQASEYFADPNPAFISAPYTVSGESGTDLILASYSEDTPNNPQNYWINLPSPGTYKVVFPNPVVSTALTVTHSGSSPYIFSQMLPRKSVGGYDIDVNAIRAYHVSATLIDTIALQVADSIVVGPELIGLKSIDGSKIIDGTISGVLIQNGTVTGNKVLAGTISGVLLQGSTITGDKIAARTISGALITAGTIKGENIEASTISGSLIAANTITAGKIAAGTITFNEIASNTLTASQIADGAITGRKIVDGTISGVLITNNSITASNIAGATITGDKIQANTISGALITAGTITSTQIATSGITAINMAANSITADNITARTITADRIVISGITSEIMAAQAVTAAVLANGAVVSGKIAADSIYGSNIIGGVITGYHVAGQTITFDKIASNTLTSGQIANGTITGQNILAGTVSGVLITNNSITATNIAGATITGDKIVARTISGALITAGTIKGENIEALTISGSLITAGTITANKLSVTQLDAVAANMGTLVVNSGISIGTNGTIWAGAGSVASPTSGLKIYTTSGISRLTTYSGGVTQIDIASNGKLLAGAGAVTLDSAGLTAGKTVVNASGITVGNLTSQLTDASALKIMGSGVSGNNGGISFFNGAYSPTAPQAQITTDATNSFVIANNTPGGSLILQNADTGNNSMTIYNSSVDIMQTTYNTQPASLRGYARDVSGGGIVRYYLGSDKVELYTASGVSTFKANANNGNITTTGDIEVLGNIHAGAGDHKFTVNGTTGNLQIGSPPHVFTVNGTTGNTNIEGVLNAKGDIGFGGTYSDKVTIQGTTGNTLILGTLKAQGDVGFGGSYSDKVTIASATGDTAIAGTLGVTGQTTLGALNASGAVGFGTSNNKVTIAAATGNTLIAGTLGVTGDVTTTNSVGVGGSLTTTYGIRANTELSAGYDNISTYRFSVGSTGDITTVGAIAAGTSNNKFTVASATGNTAIAGTLGVTGKITASDLAYITVTRTATLAITTAGTTITWQSNTRSLNASFSTTTVTVNKAGYYLVSGTFATLGNVSLTITLRYGSVNYTSNVQGTPLSTGGGYIFNFTQGLRLAAGADLQVVLTPSVNTTLNQNNEAFAGASPILNIIQLAGI